MSEYTTKQLNGMMHIRVSLDTANRLRQKARDSQQYDNLSSMLRDLLDGFVDNRVCIIRSNDKR